MTVRLAERLALVRWRRVAVFYGLTLGLTTAGTAAWRLAGGTLRGTAGTLVLNLFMLVPGLVALVLQRLDTTMPVGVGLAVRRPGGRWLLVAWLLAAGLMLLALAIGLLMPGASFSTDMEGLVSIGMSSEEVRSMRGRFPPSPAGAVGAALLQGLLLGPTVLLVAALGEELGWRGLLHRELASLGWWPRSMVTGLLWGAWHLPIVSQGYAYPHRPVLGSLLLLVLMQLLAPIYAWLRERSQSIFVPAVFHGTCGGTSAVAIAFVSGSDELLSGFTGVAGLVATAIACAIVLAACRFLPKSTPVAA